MDPAVEFLLYLAAAGCLLLAVLGGARTAANPAALLPLGLLLWLVPTLWEAGERAL
jgi:hypothetical protein